MANVKICGLNAPAALDAGADWLGFIIFPKSPRAMSVEQAGALSAPARGRARRVAVLVDPSEPLLAEVARTMDPDIIQLHGEESPARCHDARAYAREGVWKALGVARAGDLDALAPYAGAVDGFVLDAKPPKGADRPGGWGASGSCPAGSMRTTWPPPSPPPARTPSTSPLASNARPASRTPIASAPSSPPPAPRNPSRNHDRAEAQPLLRPA